MVMYLEAGTGSCGHTKIYTDTRDADTWTSTSTETLFTDLISECARNYQDDIEKLLLVMDSGKHEDRKRQKAQWRREQKEIRRLKR